jgi:hypothetical protein
MDSSKYDILFNEALATHQIDVIIILVTCFGFHIGNCSGIEQQFTIKELFELYQDDQHWSLIYHFMMQDYNYDRIKLFLLNTLPCKKELFEVYKSLKLFGCPNTIISKLIHTIAGLSYHNTILDDITSVIMFNNQLKLSISEPLYLDESFNFIYRIEKYKIFWLWLKHHNIIKDIIHYLFIFLCSDTNIHEIKIPLLLI